MKYTISVVITNKYLVPIIIIWMFFFFWHFLGGLCPINPFQCEPLHLWIRLRCEDLWLLSKYCKIINRLDKTHNIMNGAR